MHQQRAMRSPISFAVVLDRLYRALTKADAPYSDRSFNALRSQETVVEEIYRKYLTPSR